MSEEPQVNVRQADGGVVLAFEETLYPKDAIFGAAYTLLDRCYVHLDREGTKLLVRLRPKPGVTLQADVLAGEFEGEALAQAWRRQILNESRALIEGVTARALAGAAGPPGLDDLLGEDLGDLGDAFDDPLGIAVSWEEKYGKQSADKQTEAAGGQPATEAGAELATEAGAQPGSGEEHKP